MIYRLYAHPVIKQHNPEAASRPLTQHPSTTHPRDRCAPARIAAGSCWPLLRGKHRAGEGRSRPARELWFPLRHTFPSPLVRNAGSVSPHNIAWMRPLRWLTQQEGFLFSPRVLKIQEGFFCSTHTLQTHKPGAMTGRWKRSSGLVCAFFPLLLEARL